MRSAPMTRRTALAGLASLAAAPVLGDALHARAWLSLPPTPELPKPDRSGLLAVNGSQVFYAQFGVGPAVLLLHGGLGNSNYWGHQIEALTRSNQVIVMDTRGHGRSPYDRSRLSYETFAADAIALLDHLGIGAASIVGWSDGGITGLVLAMAQPKRVTRLFAFGANASPAGYKSAAGSPVFAAYTSRCEAEYAALSPKPGRWPELVRELRVMYRREPNISDRQLAAIAVPTVIAVGEHDEIVRLDHTRHMAGTIPGANLVVLPSVSHFAMLQDPAAFNAALRELLR